MSRLEGRRVGLGGVALLSPLTGIGQYTWHLATELRNRLAVAPRFFYGRSGWSEELRPPPKPTLAAGATSLVAKVIPRPELVSRFLMQRAFDAGAKDIDLYHEPHLPLRFRGPTVVTVHDLSWIRFPGMHPANRVKLMDSVMPGAVRDAVQLLVDSDFVRDEVIAHYGVAPQKVTTVRLGVSPDFAPWSAEATREVLAQQGLRHGEYLLTVGTLEPRKNLATLIEAHSLLPAALRERYPLVVVGMHGWGMDRLPERVRGLAESGAVRLLGYLPQADMPAIYSGARLFAYPSIYEGFGFPPLEAMACGVPVVVSRRASLPEIVGDAGVLVEPDDAPALATTLAALLEDPARSAALAAAGLARSREFTWERCALETLAVYERALA